MSWLKNGIFIGSATVMLLLLVVVNFWYADKDNKTAEDEATRSTLVNNEPIDANERRTNESYIKNRVKKYSEPLSINTLAGNANSLGTSDDFREHEEKLQKVTASLDKRLLTVDGDLDALLYSEHFDEIWAHEKEKLVTNFVTTLSENKYPSLEVVESICRVTLCKFVIAATNDEATDANSELLQALLNSAPVEQMQQVRVGFDESGNRVYHLYRGRF